MELVDHNSANLPEPERLNPEEAVKPLVRRDHHVFVFEVFRWGVVVSCRYTHFDSQLFEGLELVVLLVRESPQGEEVHSLTPFLNRLDNPHLSYERLATCCGSRDNDVKAGEEAAPNSLLLHRVECLYTPLNQQVDVLLPQPVGLELFDPQNNTLPRPHYFLCLLKDGALSQDQFYLSRWI